MAMGTIPLVLKFARAQEFALLKIHFAVRPFGGWTQPAARKTVRQHVNFVASRRTAQWLVRTNLGPKKTVPSYSPVK